MSVAPTSSHSTEISQPPAAENAAPSIGRRWSTPLVFLLLAGVAYAGHRTGWTMPKFSSLFGTTDSGPLWCDEHGVAEADCLLCNKSDLLKQPDYGWCAVHGVPQCLWEHPDLAEMKKPAEVDAAEAAEAGKTIALAPRAENNSICRTHQEVVQFASAEAADKAGVDIAVVGRGVFTEAIHASAEVVYDQNRVAHLTGRVAGTIARVFKQVGDRVTKGEVLAVVDAAEIGRAKADYLQALSQERLTRTNLDKLRPLVQTGGVPERQMREATTAFEEAEVRLLSTRQTLANYGLPLDEGTFGRLSIDGVARELQNLGLTAEVRSKLSGAASSSNLYPVASPLDGVVTERHVVDGEAIDGRTTIFEVVDPSRMWLMLDVRSGDAAAVAVGLPVRFRSGDLRGGGPTKPLEGTIAWVSPAIDDRTRTIRARVELANADGKLRANTFGAGQIVLRETSQAVSVPSEAVHYEGCCHVVFVRDRNWFTDGAPKFYHVRKVRLGVKQDGRTEILAGLLPGEVVAAKGSAALAAQLQRSKLGEGCGCAH